MVAKKPSLGASLREFRQELEYLYARRTTIDSLIQSLEHYDQVRTKSAAEPFKRKSA